MQGSLPPTKPLANSIITLDAVLPYACTQQDVFVTVGVRATVGGVGPGAALLMLPPLLVPCCCFRSCCQASQGLHAGQHDAALPLRHGPLCWLVSQPSPA